VVAVTTLAERALAYLREGPRPPADIVRDVLGLGMANRTVAERLAAALLGADPRFTFDIDGRWSLVPEPMWHGVPLADVRYAVVDVETTGMRPRRDDRITEIAVVHVDGVRRSVAFNSLVNPGRPIPWRIQTLTNITDAMVAAAPPFEAVADEVLAALAGRVFVAHHARFDWAFVSAEIERARDFPVRLPRLCTVRLSRRLVPELPRRNLDAVTYYFGIEIDPALRPRAAGDADATAAVFLRLLERARDRGIETLQELEALTSSGLQALPLPSPGFSPLGGGGGGGGGRGGAPRIGPVGARKHDLVT
jgi:DNA polymerase-3 subunit epsilon